MNSRIANSTVVAESEARNLGSQAGALAIWGGTIFLSAFLLFQVQPVLAKIILPWFGGGAGVWTTSLVFFQVTYLLGNLYAHGLMRLRNPLWSSRIHVALLAASLLLLPILPGASWKPAESGDPALRIFALLAVKIGLPFFLLSATSPLLQAWYVRAERGSWPYRFYALSNAGSLLALLSYPVLVEPHSTTRHQAFAWSYAYALFVAVCAWIAFRRRAAPPDKRRSFGTAIAGLENAAAMGSFGGRCLRAAAGGHNAYFARRCGRAAAVDRSALALPSEPDPLL